MLKKINNRGRLLRYIGLLLLLSLTPEVIFAQVKITEIMYDLEGGDADREWVEILNTSSQDIDLSGWRLFEGDTNHKLTHIQGSQLLAPGSFAVIVDKAEIFLSDWPSFQSMLLDSSFSFNNTGELIEIRDVDLNTIDAVTYNSEWGASGDGNSLQLINGNWISGVPTPGLQNNTGISGEDDIEDTGGGETIYVETTSIQSSFPVDLQIFANAGDDRVVIVGADTEFRGKALGLKKEPLTEARFLWNFGDGTIKEGEAVLHVYRYPGDYIVILTVSSDKYAASDRIVVTAIAAKISISFADGSKIGLTNHSNAELDISWWKLQSGNASFTLPKDTAILPNSTLTLAFEVTGLAPINLRDVALLYPNGIRVSVTAGETSKPKAPKVQSVSVVPKETPVTTSSRQISNKVVEIEVKDKESGVKELTDRDLRVLDTALAQAGEAGNGGNIYKWLLALVSLISIGSIAALIRRRDRVTAGDDIEIIE